MLAVDKLIVAGVFCVGLFFLAWWVSAPAIWWQRWPFRLAVLAMLTGLALPLALVERIRDLVSALLPLAREVGDAAGASVAVHFGLFALVAGLLFFSRPDLHRFSLPVMGVLAFVMEGLQLMVDGRSAEWTDVGINLLGVAAGWLLWRLVKGGRSDRVMGWR